MKRKSEDAELSRLQSLITILGKMDEAERIRAIYYARSRFPELLAEKKSLSSGDRVTGFDPILNAVAKVFGRTREEILSRRRTKAFVLARHAVAYLARELAQLSYPAIAAELGGRDHTTILHSCRTVEQLIRINAGFKSKLAAAEGDVRQYLNGHARG